MAPQTRKGMFMKSIINTRIQSWAIPRTKPAAITLALLGLALAASMVLAGRNYNPGVMPINSHPYGKSYGEWHTAWWQWAVSLPVDQNPFKTAL